ncbi:DUF317 domain-containing protein [Streptomyces sp. NPDC054796]
MSQARNEESVLHATPVYLAGPAASQPARLPLLHAGWRQEVDAKGNVRLTSPGGRHHVDYTPNGLTHTLWRISQAPDREMPPTWQATFATGTPPEVVAAFTTALGQDASPWPGGRRPRAQDVLRPLAEAGWRCRENAWETGFTSPDHLATVSYDTTPGHPLDADYEPWLIEGGRTLGHGHAWYAAFTTHTPAHLISALATRLGNPAPVPRTGTETLHPEATVTNGVAPSSTPADNPRVTAARSRTRVAAGGTRPRPSVFPAPTATQAATVRSRCRR